MMPTLFGAAGLGLLAGVLICFASELAPRLSPSFPKDAPPLRDAFRIWSRASRWFKWHLVTILTGGIVAVIASASASTPDEFWITGGTATFFGLVALTDLKYHLIPNALTYPALVIVIGMQLLSGVDMRSLVLGLGFTLVIFGMTAVLQPGNLGGGDVKLALVMGGLFGFPNVLISLLIGVGAGAIAAILILRGTKKGDKMAYAPYLCMGALIVLMIRP